MTVFDSSALLAMLRQEDGADTVTERLRGSSACSAANWSEVAQKTVAKGIDWPAASLYLLSSGLVVEPVTQADAEAAALLWGEGSELSLADRLCLALGARLGEVILTADGAWGAREGVIQIR